MDYRLVKCGKCIILIGLLIFLGLFYAQQINLTAVDLGRHIKNGQVIIENHRPISTNFYSYTQPNFPSLNHHWLSGVVFYSVQKFFGFDGLSIFFILLSLAAFLFFFKAAEERAGFWPAFWLAVLAIPLIARRREIRPEAFSYLFLGVYFYLFARFRDGRLSVKALLGLLSLQVLWVNLHIFFIAGPLLAGVFFVDALFNKRSQARQFFILVVSLTFVSFFNPYGTAGLLAPFTILKEYGYMVAENQSVIFMQRRFKDLRYLWLEILFTLGFLSFIPLILKKQLKKHLAEIFIFCGFSILAWQAVRGMTMFGLFFIPILAVNWRVAPANGRRWCKYSCAAVVLIVLGAGFFLKKLYYPLNSYTGIGLMPQVQNSAKFFRQTGIKGPIFNNYDIGGYLIYNLFPKERVFVDNRPESYSVSFFKDVYVPMQEKEEVWRQMDKKYGFNAIYFYRHDFTPWAQPFLIERIKDPAWAPVFVDNYVLILLKRNAQNKNLISRYELPQNIFRISQ